MCYNAGGARERLPGQRGSMCVCVCQLEIVAFKCVFGSARLLTCSGSSKAALLILGVGAAPGFRRGRPGDKPIAQRPRVRKGVGPAS